MECIVLSLGTNLGNRLENFRGARKLLEKKGVRIIRASSIGESEPVGYTDQDDFLNQILIVETDQTPTELLETCLGIEQHMGRIRTVKNGPRKIDIDLLFFRDEIITEENLVLPHPRIADRRFILFSLAELIPDAIHPVLDETMARLLDKCEDRHRVKLFISAS